MLFSASTEIIEDGQNHLLLFFVLLGYSIKTSVIKKQPSFSDLTSLQS